MVFYGIGEGKKSFKLQTLPINQLDSKSNWEDRFLGHLTFTSPQIRKMA